LAKYFGKDRQGGDKLANIKSAQKRIRVAAKRQAQNKHIKSSTKTAIKKVTVAAGAKESSAKELLIQAISAIDKAASKGVYHKNTAARKKSKLTKMVNKAAI
jgi:small subunit ribosomal protein S20